MSQRPMRTDCPHNIWFIDEVVRNVLTQLPRGGERTLARCARVCHALSEPALDVLWYKLHGVTPLLKLLSCSECQGKNLPPVRFQVDLLSSNPSPRLTHSSRIPPSPLPNGHGSNNTRVECVNSTTNTWKAQGKTSAYPSFSPLPTVHPYLAPLYFRISKNSLGFSFPLRRNAYPSSLNHSGASPFTFKLHNPCLPPPFMFRHPPKLAFPSGRIPKELRGPTSTATIRASCRTLTNGHLTSRSCPWKE